MSNALAIATVTTVLQDVLLNALLRASTEERVDAAEVLTAYPGSDPLVNGNKPRINIYLYHVAPNVSLRNNDLPSRPDRVSLDLFYLFSFYGSEDACEPQRLLGLTMRALATNAILSRGLIDRAQRNVAAIKTSNKRFVAGSDLGKAFELVKITPSSLSLEEMTKLWSVFFQTKYTLSVAYQCSVVVVEASAPAPSKPVLQRNLQVVPFKQPVIENVVSAINPDAKIVIGAEALVLGDDLLGQLTTLQVGGINVSTFAEARSNRIRFTVPAGLRAGIQGIQVIHQFNLGTPPVPHPGLESSPIGFVLSPVLTKLTRAVQGTPPTISVTATFTPAVTKTQRVTLLLRSGNASAPARVFPAAPRDRVTDPDETSTIVFTVSADVTPGKYSSSLLVDGAESALLDVEFPA